MSGTRTVLHVHQIALSVNALHVTINNPDDFLGIFLGNESFLYHFLHSIGLSSQDQCASLLGADGSHGVGVNVLQTALRRNDLNKRIY